MEFFYEYFWILSVLFAIAVSSASFYTGIKFGEGSPMNFLRLKNYYVNNFGMIHWHIVEVRRKTKKGKYFRKEVFVRAGDYGDGKVWHVYFSEKDVLGFSGLFDIKVGDYILACESACTKYLYSTVVFKVANKALK